MNTPHRHPQLRLAVSNLAWEPDQDDKIAELLWSEHITGVEIAPTKWRARPLEATAADVAAYRRAWENRGLTIVSLQSLLFGRPDLQLFGDATVRRAMLDYLRGMVDLAAALGAGVLVLGSPKNRLRGELSLLDAMAIARDFLGELGEHAHRLGTAVCLEANPPEYGGDFITTTAEAVDLCRAIDHPGIRVNADLGGMTLSGEDLEQSLVSAGPYLGHVHASEPQLAELGAAANHAVASNALRKLGYGRWVSIEMRSSGVDAVERAVALANRLYGGAVERRSGRAVER